MGARAETVHSVVGTEIADELRKFCWDNRMTISSGIKHILGVWAMKHGAERLGKELKMDMEREELEKLRYEIREKKLEEQYEIALREGRVTCGFEDTDLEGVSTL